jgi:hypothetical protein
MDELKGVRQAAEELHTLLDHVWRNREELADLLNGGPQGTTEMPESIACSNCDIQAPPSIAAALREGWIEIECDPDGLGYNYVGFCPNCQQAEYEEALANAVREPVSKPDEQKSLFR